MISVLTEGMLMDCQPPMNIHTCTAKEARARTRAAIPMIGFRSPESPEPAGAMVMAVDTDLGVEASGFF